MESNRETFSTKAIRLSRDVAADTRLYGFLTELRGSVASQSTRPFLDGLLTGLLKEIDGEALGMPVSGLRVLSTIPTQSHRVVAMLGADSGVKAVLKLAQPGPAVTGLEREARFLHMLHEDERFRGWARFAPRLLGHGFADDCFYTAESAIPGRGLNRIATPANAGDAARQAAITVRRLHLSTATRRQIDERLVDLWVEPPLAALSSALTQASGYREWQMHALGYIRERVRTILVSRRLEIGFIHGDFYPNNILMGPTLRVFGVVDWELARDDFPIQLDLFTLLLAMRMRAQRRLLGSVVAGFIKGDVPTDAERSWLASEELDDPELCKALALLTWLHIASSSASRRPDLVSSRVWQSIELLTVLAAAEDRAATSHVFFDRKPFHLGGRGVAPSRSCGSADPVLEHNRREARVEHSPRLSESTRNRIQHARSQLRLGVDHALDEARFRLDVLTGMDYQPLPGVRTLRLQRARRDSGSWSRLEQIAHVVEEVGASTAVDVGANSGFFSLALAERGLDVVAIEPDPKYARVLDFMARRAQVHGVVARMALTINEQTLDLVPVADAVLLLSVWHHMVRYSGLDAATSIVRQLWAHTRKVLFFDTGQKEMGAEFRLPDMTPSPREWIESYLRETCADGEVRHLGSHQAFDPRGTPVMRELFAVVRIPS